MLAQSLLCQRYEPNGTIGIEAQIFSTHTTATVTTWLSVLAIRAIMVDVVPLTFELND